MPAGPASTRAVGERERWDRANVHELTGTYGEYLLAEGREGVPPLTTGS